MVLKAKHDHSAGLCGHVDNTEMTLAQVKANPPPCLCCGRPVRATDSLSLSFQQLGMFEVWCDWCHKDKRKHNG